MAGVRGLIRDNQGNWIKRYIRHLGSASDMVDELWGIRDRLTMALQVRIQQMEIETNSIVVLDLN